MVQRDLQRFWRRIGHKVTGLDLPRPLFIYRPRFLYGSPRSPPTSAKGELLRLYCRALKQRKRRKNNTALLPRLRTREVARTVRVVLPGIYTGERLAFVKKPVTLL